MKLRNQIYYLINLFYEAKFSIILIIIFFTSSAIIYHNNIENKKFADIRITAIPKADLKSVDVFTLFESEFRDYKNFEMWKKNNIDTKIENQNITGYKLDKNKLVVDRTVIFKNAMTYKRSIYMMIPARSSKEIRDFFSYALFTVDKINTSDVFNIEKKTTKLLKSSDEFFILYAMVKSSVGLNINVNNNDPNEISNIKKLQKSIIPTIKEIEELKKNYNEYKSDDSLDKNISAPLLVINPPENIYNTKIKLSKILFISTLLSLLSIVLVLIYVDYKKNYK